MWWSHHIISPFAYMNLAIYSSTQEESRDTQPHSQLPGVNIEKRPSSWTIHPLLIVMGGWVRNEDKLEPLWSDCDVLPLSLLDVFVTVEDESKEDELDSIEEDRWWATMLYCTDFPYGTCTSIWLNDHSSHVILITFKIYHLYILCESNDVMT